MFSKTLSTIALLFSFVAHTATADVSFDKEKLKLLNGVVGTEFSVDLRTLLKDPGVPPYQFAGSGLPGFLSIAGNTLKGTPTSKGAFNFKLTVRDSTPEGTDLNSPATLTVIPQAPNFKVTDLDLGIQKEEIPWSYDLKTQLEDPSVVSSFSATGLPNWITLDPNTGILSGTPKRPDVGNYSGIKITAKGDGGSDQITAHGTVLKVVKRPKWTANKIDLGTTNEDEKFEKESTQYVINPEPLDLSYTIVSMTPPPWLNIGKKSGTLFGTPSKPGKVEVVVSFSYVLDGSTFSESTTFFFEIKHVNHPPYWTANPIVIPQVAKTSVQFSTNLSSSAKDPDEGDTLSYKVISGPAWAKVDASSGVLSGIPGKSDVGLNKIIVQVADQFGASDQTEVRINVEKSNEPPTWNSHPVVLGEAKEDQLFEVDLTAHSSDPDGDRMYYTVLSTPTWVSVSSSGVLTGKPKKGDIGLNKIQVKVSDQKSSPDDITELHILVIHVNHAPYWVMNPMQTEVLEEDLFSFNVSPYAKDDDDNDVLTFGVISGPSWATMNSKTGVISGTPTHANEGKNEWTIRVSDAAGLTADAKLIVNVKHKNHAPEWIEPVALPNAKEDAPYTASLKDFVKDVDLPNDSLRFVKISQKPDWIKVADDGTLTGTPTQKDIGTFFFEVRVLDLANASDVTSAKIVIEATNHAPVWRQKPLVLDQAYEDKTYKFDLTPFALDPDGDKLTFSLVSGPAWMFVGEAGQVTGVPTAKDVGIQKARFKVADPKGLFDETDATVEVIHTNHPPVVETLPLFEVKIRETLTQDLKAWIKDLDNDPMTCIQLGTTVPWLNIKSDCSFTASPTLKNQIGDHSFDFKVDDKQLFTVGVLKIRVLKNPRPPIWLTEPITPSPLEGKTNVAFSGNVKDRAKDLDGDTLTFSKKTGNAWLSVSADGSLSGTPKEADLGENKFTLTVCNTEKLCSDGTLIVTVKPGVQVDKVQIDTAVPGAPAEYVWDLDNSDHCDKTIRDLKNNIQVFYDALNTAQLHHSGVFISSDAKKFDGKPIYDGSEPILMLWSNQNIVSSWRHRVDLAYSDGFCNNCNSSPIWAMYRFLERLPNMSEIYKNGYMMPGIPMDAMMVSHQMDHYKYYTKNMPAFKNYTPADFARDFILAHRKEEKPYRVSAIAPECPTLLETSGDPQSVGPANSYRVVVDKTGGTYYTSGCSFDAPKTLKDWAQKIIFRAYVHAKHTVQLSKTPLSANTIKVTIGGVLIPGGTGSADDKWTYDPSTNSVKIRWFLIDEGQLKPGQLIEIEYRVS